MVGVGMETAYCTLILPLLRQIAYNGALFFMVQALGKMTDTKLNTKEILELKARAHHLNPVVMVGQQGLTDSVIRETDAALTAHELIKVRVFGDDRAERIEICNALCEAVDAQLVQHIGKLLVLWRKNIEA